MSEILNDSQPKYGVNTPSGDKDLNKEKVVVPPPAPIEISVRTMESDLENMGRSLEEALRSMSSVAQNQSQETAPSLPSILNGENQSASKNWTKLTIWGVVAAAGIIALFFMGYFFLPFIFGEKPKESSPEAAINPPSANLPVKETDSAVFLEHRSFLRNPGDKELKLEFKNSTSPSYYNLYLENLKKVLYTAGTESRFVEIVLVQNENQNISWTQMLELLGISAIEESFWSNRFEQDFTFFANLQNGIWYPGFILKLKFGQSPLALQSTVSKIESDVNLKNFFLDSPGDAQDGFRDFQISGQPVRMQSWSKSDAAFVYGWLYNQYLVISTSEGGFREAMLRL